MKKAKRLVALLLAGVLTAGCLAGCGGKGKESSKAGKSASDVEISFWLSGLGSAWLTEMIEAFEEKHPEYNVYFNETASYASATAAYGLKDTDTVDLYMACKMYDTTYMEPLNDVLETTVEGESKSIKEKFNATYLTQEEYNGNYYTLTYGGGIAGFIYNKNLFKQAGVTQVPRTTDELAVACGTLKDKGITPLCHYKVSGYYYMMDEVWFAQYNGRDYYLDFHQNPTKEKMLTDDGRYEAVKVHEKLNTPNYTLEGSNTGTHISMQTKFLEGQCAMMLTGSWLSTEMSSHTDKLDDFAMMKTPVISAIKDKLTTIKNDAQLRKLITAIDNVTAGTESIDTYKDGDNYLVEGMNVSAADWDYVKAARNTAPSTYAGATAFIPNYSNAKEGAKEFLKFMYSDEGYQIYLKNCHSVMPFELSEGKVDTTGWNEFEKQQLEFFEQTEHIACDAIMSRDRIFVDGGAGTFAGYEYISLMCSNSEADRINAKQAWDKMKLIIEENYEKTWLNNVKK